MGFNCRYTLDIEAVSCDEMFVDCSEILSYANVDVLEFAAVLRKEIKVCKTLNILN